MDRRGDHTFCFPIDIWGKMFVYSNMFSTVLGRQGQGCKIIGIVTVFYLLFVQKEDRILNCF
jgi:hypothetical protein